MSDALPISFSARARRYCDAVVAGDVIACKWVVMTCQRHLDDLEASKSPDFPFEFDEKRADRACRILEELPHTKGKWAKKNRLNPRAHLLKLEDWQVFIIASIFGWVIKETRYRRFRKASIYVPRKNGKSIFAAGIGIILFAFDQEFDSGAEVYSGATSRAQAMEVFKPAREMIRRRPELAEAKGITIHKESLTIDDDGSVFKPLIGKPGDGASPSCAIVDEFHQHPTDALYSAMETGMGARPQPLLGVISTAGFNLLGPCREDWEKCENILKKIFKAPDHFCIIFTVDTEEEWSTLEGVRKANPNFGISIFPEFLEARLNEAKQTPAAQSAFKTKHCNVWTASKEGYFNHDRWVSLGDKSLSIESMIGRPVYIASDFAAKSDLTVTIFAFPLDDGGFAVFGKYYLPRATIELEENIHYRTWSRDGFLTVSGGDITDTKTLVDDIVAASKIYSVQKWLFDPTKVYGIMTQLIEEGIPAQDVLSNSKNLSMPMRNLSDLIASGKIKHNGDPVLSWAISNVIGLENRAGQVYPTKPTKRAKIDPAVALMMVIYWILKEGENPVSDFKLQST